MNNFPKHSDSYPSLAFLQVFPVFLNYTPIHSPVIANIELVEIHFLEKQEPDRISYIFLSQLEW